MFDDCEGTLRLRRDLLGDERVPNLSLPQLRDAYGTGTGNLRSWTTAGSVGKGEFVVSKCGLIFIVFLVVKWWEWKR